MSTVTIPFKKARPKAQTNHWGEARSVTLSENFMFQTDRYGSNQGILMGDADQEGKKKVLIHGEDKPINVHEKDITYGAFVPYQRRLEST